MTKEKRKCVVVSAIRVQLETANMILASPVSQKVKKDTCSSIEILLHKAGLYKGFNYNYWMEQGCELWKLSGEPDFPEKEDFIIGRAGVRAKKENDDNFVSALEGDFSRTYFAHPDLTKQV